LWHGWRKQRKNYGWNNEGEGRDDLET
jgi:hypothetical protein